MFVRVEYQARQVEPSLLTSPQLRVYCSTSIDVVSSFQLSVNFYPTILRHVPEDNLWFSRTVSHLESFSPINSLSGFDHTTILCSLSQAKNQQLRVQYRVAQIYCHDLCVTIDGVWICEWIYWPLIPDDLELQVITAPQLISSTR
jgi:hypothetical protein